jgi:MFS family permease
MKRKKPSNLPWLIIIAGCLIALLSFGPRSAMGFFQLPMLADTGWDRTTFGLAMAIQNLFWGIGQPFFGAIADKFGTWRVLALSSVIYSGGLIMMANADSPAWLHIGGGVLVGLGIASASFGIVLAAFARNVAPEQRSLAFGFGTAAGSAGMFVFAPLSQGLIDALGWSDALVWLGILMLVIPVLAIPLRGNSSSGSQKQTDIEQSIGQALREAFGHHSYLLLVSGFFVCGFQVAFITAHFPAYLRDIIIAEQLCGAVAGADRFFQHHRLAGLRLFIGQRHSKPIFLALIYIGRSIAVTAFLLLPQTPTSVVVFAIVMGCCGCPPCRPPTRWWRSCSAPPSRAARRRGVLHPPDRLIPRRLARRLPLRYLRLLRSLSGGWAWRSGYLPRSSTGRSGTGGGPPALAPAE